MKKLQQYNSFLFAAAIIISLAIFNGPLVAGEEVIFTDEELARLDKGEMVVRHVEKKQPDKSTSSRLVTFSYIPYPPEVIWSVLNHPELEPEWIEECKESVIIKDECTSPTTRSIAIDYKLKSFGIEAVYSIVRYYDYEKKTIFGQMDKDRPHKIFEDVKAGWELIPYKKGVIFKYWSDTKFSWEPPAFIKNFLEEAGASQNSSFVRKRCDQIAKDVAEKKTPINPCEGK
jgi:Polyketide cyclase / dehydrase and lipid transport